ncbi:MAG TPA: DUF2232 domain-containing protein [Gemmatimonadaceae bacterium]|nr:DUF2232 domain-containing protein [Gemmatimonadaceae bacterium]
MTEPAAPTVVRQSWRRLAIGVVAFTFASTVPHLRPIMPIEQTWLLLAPIVAACAVVAWRLGGKLWIAIAAVAVAVVFLAQPVGPGDSPYGWLARGWSLLLAASFGLVCLFAPNEPFFPRALSALAVALALSFALVLVSPGGPLRVGNLMVSELNRRNDETLAASQKAQSLPEIKKMMDGSPGLRWVYEETDRQIAAIPEWTSKLIPALLAIESLIAMALGWAIFQRVSQVAIGPPLGRLREFKFNDQLVWGVAVGASIYLLPNFAEGRNSGLNLLLFFGLLYILRGAGILAWMTRSRIAGAVLVLLAISPVWPFIAALAFGIGLGDTWLDWRTRMPARPN